VGLTPKRPKLSVIDGIDAFLAEEF